MAKLVTRPIPGHALESDVRNRISLIKREALAQENDAVPTEFSFQDAPAPSQISSWGRVQETIAASALGFLLASGTNLPPMKSAGDFLVVLDDEGLTRPILDLNEVTQVSRAAVSMRPMDLSQCEAATIAKSLAAGSARPKIEIKPLSHF